MSLEKPILMISLAHNDHAYGDLIQIREMSTGFFAITIVDISCDNEVSIALSPDQFDLIRNFGKEH